MWEVSNVASLVEKLVHTPDGKKPELSWLLTSNEEPSAILSTSQDSMLNIS